MSNFSEALINVCCMDLFSSPILSKFTFNIFFVKKKSLFFIKYRIFLIFIIVIYFIKAQYCYENNIQMCNYVCKFLLSAVMYVKLVLAIFLQIY